MVKNQLFIAAALFVGVAIGYFLKPDKSVAETEGDTGYVAASKIDDKGEGASVAALRVRIAELEKLLAARPEAAPQDEKAKVPEASADAKDGRHGPPSMKEMRERIEKMAKEEPEKFAQMTNRMARWRQRRIDRANAKLDFLQAVDTSTMTAAQKKAHEAYQELLVRREELEEKMQNPEMMDADREDIMRDMHETEHAMRQAARQERTTLIDQTVQSLGFSGDDAATVSATISDIISTTEQGHGGPPPPDGGGQGGPGGGGQGGPGGPR